MTAPARRPILRYPHDNEIIEKARKIWEDPGDLEIGNPEDAHAMVSHAPDHGGAWVRAWVWVDCSDLAKGGCP